MDIKKIVLLAAVALTGKIAAAQNIPLDPALRTGKLANGFTYYIRHNAEPQKRVELYLVNKVGSIMEDDDQQGLAHFMEHMNFNGTTNYPKNNLVDYLQKAGVRFGADLNAYTSFDETVYQLPLPTDNPAMFASGLSIMRDWAQEATLDPAEIEKERGVIMEEERLGKGARDRMSRQYLPMLVNNARYAQRMPIGKDEVLTKFKPGVIRRFFTDWYRPDLQALIIVGDIDVAEAENLVKAKFADLKTPSKLRERTVYNIALTGKQQFMAVTDKEQANASIEVMMKHYAPEVKTEQDYLAQIKRGLFNQLINTRRYAETSRESDAAYTGMGAGINGFIGNVDMFSFNVSAKEGHLQQSFEQTWLILERIKRYGFSQDELDRAKQNQLRNLETSVKEKTKTSSVSYVNEYKSLFLKGEASPGIEWEYQFTKNNIANISLADINALMNEYLASKDVDILVIAPEKIKVRYPIRQRYTDG